MPTRHPISSVNIRTGSRERWNCLPRMVSATSAEGRRPSERKAGRATDRLASRQLARLAISAYSVFDPASGPASPMLVLARRVEHALAAVRGSHYAYHRRPVMFGHEQERHHRAPGHGSAQKRQRLVAPGPANRAGYICPQRPYGSDSWHCGRGSQTVNHVRDFRSPGRHLLRLSSMGAVLRR
jgi:hypothetical protein